MVSVNQPLEGGRRDLAYFIFQILYCTKFYILWHPVFVVLFHKIKPVLYSPRLLHPYWGIGYGLFLTGTVSYFYGAYNKLSLFLQNILHLRVVWNSGFWGSFQLEFSNHSSFIALSPAETGSQTLQWHVISCKGFFFFLLSKLKKPLPAVGIDQAITFVCNTLIDAIMLLAWLTTWQLDRHISCILFHADLAVKSCLANLALGEIGFQPLSQPQTPL